MRSRLVLSCILLCLCTPASLIAQTALSASSGISTGDTWVTLDMTVNDSATVNLSQSYYNPSTKSYTTTMPVDPSPRTFHVEAGYDSNGGLVMNLYPKGTTQNPDSTDTSNLSCIRLAGGKVTVIDQNGNILPNVLPDPNISTSLPLSLLGSNPGPSVIASLVVPNIQQFAIAVGTSPKISGNTALVTTSLSQSTTENWTYVQSGNNWLAQQVVVALSSSDISDTHTIQFANLNWSDNASKDDARAAAGSTIQTLPTAGPVPTSFAGSPAPVPAYSQNVTTVVPSECNTQVYNFGGSQNIVFQHGLNSSSCTWTRMANWLNQDFLFGKEVVPSLDAGASIATQGQELISEIKSVTGQQLYPDGSQHGRPSLTLCRAKPFFPSSR